MFDPGEEWDFERKHFLFLTQESYGWVSGSWGLSCLESVLILHTLSPAPVPSL